MTSHVSLFKLVLTISSLLSPGNAVTEECGVRKQHLIEGLILDGEDAKPGETPWHAGLYRRNSTDLWKVFCGGSLISHNVVVTAAHCIKLNSGIIFEPRQIKVVLGKHSSDFSLYENFSTIADVNKLVFPEAFVGFKTNFALDIALLQLAQNVEYNDYIQPVCLDLDNRVVLAPEQNVSVSGFGATRKGGTSEILQTAKLPFLELTPCLKLSSVMSVDKICAKSDTGTQVAKGDSGGGMTVDKPGKDNKVHSFLIGVVSYRVVNESQISMFTNIYNIQILAWIKDEWHRLEKGIECSNESYCSGDAGSVNNCTPACGPNAECKIYDPVCRCQEGFVGDPEDEYIGCQPKKPEKEFVLVEEERSWFEAQKYCKSDNKTLAVIWNRNDQYKLEHLILNMDLKEDKFWLAANDLKRKGNDLKRKGRFKWVLADGKLKSLDYSKWAEEEPSAKNRSCVALHKYSWITEDCSKEYGFICQ